MEVKKIEIYNLKGAVNFLKKDVAVREIISRIHKNGKTPAYNPGNILHCGKIFF